MASDQAASDHAGSDAAGFNNNDGNQASGAGAVLQTPNGINNNEDNQVSGAGAVVQTPNGINNNEGNQVSGAGAVVQTPNGINNNEGNQASGAGAVAQATPGRPAISMTTATLPDNSTATLTKGRTLIDALGRVTVPMSKSTTLLIITLTVGPELLSTSHPDHGKEGLKPRQATMFVDYISTERIRAIVNAKARSSQGGRGNQPRRLCYKCLAYDPVSTDPTRRTIDLTMWNRSNPLRHVMEYHPLRMIMHATIPVEVTWHKSCLNEQGKTLSKVREEWIDSTPGSLFRILDADVGTALPASTDTPKVKLFGVLPPPPVEPNVGRSFDYAGFVTKLWNAGVEVVAENEDVGPGMEVDGKNDGGDDGKDEGKDDGGEEVNHDGNDVDVKKEEDAEMTG